MRLFISLNEVPVADPETKLHCPVPVVGAVAAKVTVVRPQVAELVWSDPAFAAEGAAVKLSTTSSVEEAQGLLLIVHLSVYVPAPPEGVNVAL